MKLDMSNLWTLMGERRHSRILAGYATSLLGVLSGLLTTLWLFRTLAISIDPQDFGTYLIILQITSYFAIIQIGLDFSAAREISEQLGRGDVTRAAQAFGVLLNWNRKLSAVVFFLAAALAMIFYAGGTLLPLASLGNAVTSSTLIAMFGLAQTISFLGRPYSAALIGSGNQVTVNIISVVRTLATTGLALILVHLINPLYSVPIAEILLQSVQLMLLKRSAKRRCANLLHQHGSLQKEASNKILHFSIGTTIQGLGWTVEATSDLFILGVCLGAASAAEYAIWWQAPLMIFTFCTRLAGSSVPEISRAFGESSNIAVRLVQRIGYITIGLSGLSFVGLALWLTAFVHLWLPNKLITDPSGLLSLLFAILVSLRVMGNFLALTCISRGDVWHVTILSWCQAGLKVTLALCLIPLFQINGLVLASCFAAALQVISLLYLTHRFEIISSTTVSLTILTAFFATTTYLTTVHIIQGVPTHATWFTLILGSLLITIAWFAIYTILLVVARNVETYLKGDRDRSSKS